MKRNVKISTVLLAVCLALCALTLSACQTTRVYVPDPNPYTFTNRGRSKPVMDDDMTIDGKFDEARWQNSRWLQVRDKPAEQNYADISFTTSYGEKGIYFGIEVKEYGSYVFYNPARETYINSCIEMYIAPYGYEAATYLQQIMEFNFLPDGTVFNRINSGSNPAEWVDKVTVWEKMPVSASIVTGGTINVDATGYIIETFVPFSFLEYCGWDVSDPETLVLGIDPVHIFSYTYDGDNVNEDRYWSRWSSNQGYIASQWLNPNTFFRFGKSGLLAYDLNVTYGGTGSGIVTTSKGLPLLQGRANTLYVKPRNSSSLTKFTVDGVDRLSELRDVGGYYEFELAATDTDVEISADFAS